MTKNNIGELRHGSDGTRDSTGELVITEIKRFKPPQSTESHWNIPGDKIPADRKKTKALQLRD